MRTRALVVAGAFRQQGELVAAVARDQHLARQLVLEPARDLQQQAVAGAVAEAVVDPLEAVQVQEQHRVGEAAAALFRIRRSASLRLNSARFGGSNAQAGIFTGALSVDSPIRMRW